MVILIYKILNYINYIIHFGHNKSKMDLYNSDINHVN